LALVKYYFDFFKYNHEEINARLLLTLKMDPDNEKFILSQEQFAKLDSMSKDSLSEESKAELLCRLFGLNSPLSIDINEFLLVLRLLFSQKIRGRLEQ
jgi:hypothetical protein